MEILATFFLLALNNIFLHIFSQQFSKHFPITLWATEYSFYNIMQNKDSVNL